ncbi:MAG: hypothetical protein F6K54_16770 [Okeania sp. SIO3B5]|nr:hypothetical protein [Okeania sp. SIO3B5]NEO54589.1 hypothetical protein [Okeania sp. SIO3B5]
MNTYALEEVRQKAAMLEAEAVRPRVGVRRKGMRTPVRKEKVRREKVFYH